MLVGASNITVDGNTIVGNGSNPNLHQDLLSDGGISNLTVQGNTFAGTASQLVYINGAIDVGTPSQSVNFINNKFTGVATGGVDLVDDAASGNLTGNSFSGSGDAAIFLGGISENTANEFGLTAVPGAVTVSGNDFSHWTGVDVSDFIADYTFKNGGAGHSLTVAINASGQETDTLSGFQNGDKIGIDNGFGFTVLAAVQNGSNEVDVRLSDGDEIVVQGNNISANTIGSLVGAPALTGALITIPGTATGNLGQVGGNGPTTVDGSATNGVTFKVGDGPDGVFVGNNDHVTIGNGPDSIFLSGNGNTVSVGNGPDTVQVLGNSNTVTLGNGPDTVMVSGDHNIITGGNGPDSFTLSGNDNTLKLLGNNNTILVTGGSGNSIVDSANDHVSITVADTGVVGFSIAGFSVAHGGVDLAPGGGAPTTFAGVLGDMVFDGHGGTALAYGGSPIDFLGIAKAQFQASDFTFHS